MVQVIAVERSELETVCTRRRRGWHADESTRSASSQFAARSDGPSVGADVSVAKPILLPTLAHQFPGV